MAGDPKTSLIERLQRDASDDGAWSALFDLEAVAGDAAAVLGLLEQRHELRRDAANFAFASMHRLAHADQWSALERLPAVIPKANLFHGLFAYGAALNAAHRFDLDETAQSLRQAAHYAMTGRQGVFAHEALDFVNALLLQAGLIEKANYAAASPPGPAVNLPQIAGPGPLFFACCDEIYFIAYAERFLRSLNTARPGSAALIHVINPDARGEALRARLTHEFPAAAFSTEIGPADTAYYASRRLMLGPAVRQRYPLDLVMMDVDSIFPAYLPALLDRARESALAYIAPPEQILPYLRVSGAFLYLPANSAVADAFLAHCAGYLDRKFNEGEAAWFVDQAALFRALCLCRGDGDVLDLAAGDPNVLGGFVGPHLVTQAMREGSSSRNRSIRDVTFDADLRPMIRFADPPG